MQLNQQKVSIYQPLGLYNRLIVLPAVSAMFLSCFGDVPFAVKIAAVLCLLLFLAFFLLYSHTAVSASYPKSRYMPQHKEKQPARLVIYTNDVKEIYHCSDSTAARKISLVRDTLAKLQHQSVTIKEFCDYYGLDYLQTCEFLKLV